MGGGGSSTTVQKADPWIGAQPFLHQALGDGFKLYKKGGFAPDPYDGNRVAGFGDMSRLSHMMTLGQSAQPTATGQAKGTLSDMMSRDYRTANLEAVKGNALGSAVPAAVAQFAGSGMGNSTLAMDTVGRAATEAVSPYEYDAYNQSEGRALSAASMAPDIDAAGYLPSQMLAATGSQIDAMNQREIDADMQRYYEGENQQMDALNRYSQLLLGYGGQGSSGTSTQSNSESTSSKIGTGLQVASLIPLLFSDRRLKRNVARIGETPGGSNLYAFKYLWDETEHIGVMADEVPHAVAGRISGFAVVDYSRVT